MLVAAIQAPSGVVLEFLVLFAVILLGPIVFARLGLPGLIGLLLGGFAIGPHVLAVVAGTQTGSGSAAVVLAEIGIGLLVLLVVGLFALPRAVDAALRRWGSDRVARYLVILVALLFMAMLAEVFGIEGIVGAF